MCTRRASKDVVLIVLLDFFPLSPATTRYRLLPFTSHSGVVAEERRRKETDDDDGEWRWWKKKCREESQPTQTTPTNVIHTLFFISFFSPSSPQHLGKMEKLSWQSINKVKRVNCASGSRQTAKSSTNQQMKRKKNESNFQIVGWTLAKKRWWKNLWFSKLRLAPKKVFTVRWLIFFSSFLSFASFSWWKPNAVFAVVTNTTRSGSESSKGNFLEKTHRENDDSVEMWESVRW